MFHLVVAFIIDIFRKAFRITVAAYVALNRWMAFLAHLTMMFFMWNFLLFVIGVFSTIQMAIGFGFDVIRVTSSKPTSSNGDLSPPDNNNGNVGGEKRRSAINEYWHNRRKGYQEMVDSLYIKYMNRLVGVQQQQQQFFAERQYFNRMDAFQQDDDQAQQYLLEQHQGNPTNPGVYMDNHYPNTVNAVGRPEAFVADDYHAVSSSSAPPSYDDSTTTTSMPSIPSIPSEPHPSMVQSPIDFRGDLTSQLPVGESVTAS